MSLAHFFLSPHGRVCRQAFWLGLIALSAASLPISVMLAPELVSGSTKITAPSLASTLWSLALVWPSAAISIKRFNDRDWPPWIGYVLFLAMFGMVIANYAGLLLDPKTMSDGEKLVFSSLLFLFVWALIDNGFYRGTEGPNRYGPDPLESQQPAGT